MHDSKIQGMKLATAPLLCHLSPVTSVALCCVCVCVEFFGGGGYFSITNEVAEKCRSDLLWISTVEWSMVMSNTKQ